MQPIIAPVDRNLLIAELTSDRFVRPTNKAGNLIYDFSAHEAPNLMREVARLREESYRPYGSSLGHEMDTDVFDTMDKPYRQLIVWDPDNQEIVAGYRYMMGRDVVLKADGQPNLSSSHILHYSDTFIRDYLPVGMELGRAFVQPKYTTRDAGIKALFALDNIWDGLGALIHNNPHLRYLFGKVTTHSIYHAYARELIFAFLERYYHQDLLAKPIVAIPLSKQAHQVVSHFPDDTVEGFHALQRTVRELGTTVSPMFSAYLNLSDTMAYFGSSLNDELGSAYESGIMMDLERIYPEKIERYITPYIQWLASQNISEA